MERKSGERSWAEKGGESEDSRHHTVQVEFMISRRITECELEINEGVLSYYLLP